MADTVPLKTGYLTNVEGDKLYSHSHVQTVRYNKDKTLEQKLVEMEDKLGVSSLFTPIFDTDGTTIIGFKIQ